MFLKISEKPFISSFTEILSKSKKSLNILWTLDDEIQGSIFEFIIILKNSTNICAHLIHVMCTNCEDPMNQVNTQYFYLQLI